MPSLAHHVLVDLFREQPALAPRLLELSLGLRLPRGVACQLGDTTLDHLRPVERRADLVLELHRRGRPILAVVLEVQRRRDARKWLAWADYLISKRRTCRACVLVIATDAHVAAWAARPFDLGPGNEALRVWVLGPEQITAVTDVDAAREAPELALLSALAHATTQPATLATALECLPALSGNLAEVYYAVLEQHLPARMRPTLEALTMRLTMPPNTGEGALTRLFRRKAAEVWGPIFHERGLQEGLKLGREEARAAAALASRRTVLLRLMNKAGFTVSDAQRRRVERCVDSQQLDRWIDRVLTASSAREVFAVRRVKPSDPAAPTLSKRAKAAPKRTRRPAAG